MQAMLKIDRAVQGTISYRATNQNTCMITSSFARGPPLSVADSDFQIKGGRSSRPWDGGGRGVVSKKFFFGLKIKIHHWDINCFFFQYVQMLKTDVEKSIAGL